MLEIAPLDQAEAPKTMGARTAHDSRAGLALRLAVALGASSLAGLATDRLMATAVPDVAVRIVLSALLAATLVGLALYYLVVSPLARSRADLHDRYEAALADALQDPLTGLGNHRAFQEELDRQVESAQRYGTPLSLAIVDLDEFKAINDGRGHAFGDRALTHFGTLVAASLRRADRPFRIGGDEFAILLPHTDAEGAKIVIRRLLASALQPALRMDRDPGSLSFSAGISALPEPASGRAQLYSQADAALYAAKRSGRTDVQIFDASTEPAEDTGGVGMAVAEVIARGWLRPVYQPIIELKTGALLGVEGLIRPVSPAPFADPGSLFSAAAASGHVVALDLKCIETIVAGAVDLVPGPFLSVNVSPATVQAPEFSTAALLSILAKYNFPPERLVLELTEQQQVTDLERLRLKLDTCRGAGIRLAADDVGAGYNGLRLLAEVTFDVIKVDLTLVQRSASSASSSAVIESVVALAGRTGALVVAEGIEYPEQLEQLDQLGITIGQGFLLGRPGSLPGSDPSATTAAAAEPLTVMDTTPVAAGAASMSAWRQSIGLPVA
ncbi:MAG TPA: EAL domain-containing protein [Candidatus Limnocylindria bacterium]|nr:EAL domain-containing protein [Candidatus Limnocylindria bacterium]